MAFDEGNYETTTTDGEDLPEESNNNRTFMIAVGILGGLILISMACLGGFLLLRPSGTTPADQANVVNATQTAVANQEFIRQSLTSTFQASILPTATLSPTPTSTPPVGAPSATPTNNPLELVATATGSGAGTQIAATSTVAAALTQAASAQKTAIALPSPTKSALPSTGIADEYGLPGLFALALAFVIVILFARRLRVAPTR